MKLTVDSDRRESVRAQDFRCHSFRKHDADDDDDDDNDDDYDHDYDYHCGCYCCFLMKMMMMMMMMLMLMIMMMILMIMIMTMMMNMNMIMIMIIMVIVLFLWWWWWWWWWWRWWWRFFMMMAMMLFMFIIIIVWLWWWWCLSCCWSLLGDDVDQRHAAGHRLALHPPGLMSSHSAPCWKDLSAQRGLGDFGTGNGGEQGREKGGVPWGIPKMDQIGSNWLVLCWFIMVNPFKMDDLGVPPWIGSFIL